MAVILFYLFSIFSSIGEKPFKQQKLEITNIVHNNTNKPYIDSVIHVGLDKLEISNINITIYKLTDNVRYNVGDNNIKAFIKKFDKDYVIWIDNLTREETITVLSHELIHLQQYENKKLIIKEDHVIWDNEEYYGYRLYNLEYHNRPWETEAYNKQYQLKTQIKNYLY